MLARVAVGRVLRDHRLESSMTLRELSKKSGASLGYISEVERGIKDPSSEMLEDLCDALDITVAELLVGAVGDLNTVAQ